MDFQKLDPVLAAELSGGSDPTREYPVFIQVAAELGPGNGEALARRLDLPEPVPAGGVLSLAVTGERIGELSEEPWVVVIRSARQLRTLREGLAPE